MRVIQYFLLSILFLSSCNKLKWNNPFDPECPKELFTPSQPGATMEGNRVKLKWSQENDNISGFTLFKKIEEEPMIKVTQLQKNTTQYLDANIIPGKKYTYYILAVAGTNTSDTIKAEITPVLPITITTGVVTDLTLTSAKISGNISNSGGGTVTSRGICWSTNQNPTVSNSKTVEGSGAGQFTSTLSELITGTTYYARAYGENSRGIVYGNEVSFKSGDSSTLYKAPVLVTNPAFGINSNTIITGGNITSDGGSPIMSRGVVWSTSPNPTIDQINKTNDGNGLGFFSSTISNLTTNTQYYIRAFASNIAGISYGNEIIFTLNEFSSLPIIESLKNGLVAFYPFNGNANDESGNGNNGVIIGATKFGIDRFNSSEKTLLFNGVSTVSDIYEQIDINREIVPYKEYSISGWFKSSNFSKPQQCILVSIPRGEFEIELNNPAWPSRLLFTNGCCGHGTEMQILNNSWYHIVYNKSLIRGPSTEIITSSFYINGYKVKEVVSERNGPQNNPSFGIRIGSFGLGNAIFSGNIDDIRIYNRILTQAEITYLSNN